MKANSQSLTPLLLIGGLGLIAAMATQQGNTQQGQDSGLLPFIFGSGNSGTEYQEYTEQPTPDIYFPSVPEAVINMPSLDSLTGGISYVADAPNTKKAARENTYSDPVLSLANSASLTPLSNFERNEFNSRLSSSIVKKNRTGGGSVANAISFMSIPSIDGQMRATIDNPGISNAGRTLTLVTNPNGSYQAYDWKRNIVGSGSAGALSGTKKAARETSYSSSSSGSSSQSSKSKNVSHVAAKAGNNAAGKAAAAAYSARYG